MSGSPPLMLFGLLLVLLGVALFVLGTLCTSVVLLAGLANLRPFCFAFLYGSGLPVMAGIALAAIDLTFALPNKRRREGVRSEPVANQRMTVVLTALDDELSIGASVEDFLSHPLVARVLVVDNDSADGTRQAAERAGATVIREEVPGYGSCVYRAFQEALKHDDTELVLICEGDMTFRAADIDKFLAYIPHAEIVNGTRIVEQLRERDTQLSTFIYYGNFSVGKLLELKHLGRGTFTDVGTTYKLCRRRALAQILPHLDPSINLEFNAHFLDTALGLGTAIVECPITFFARVGPSKGGNVNDVRALQTGLRMIVGMLVSWRLVAERRPADR